MNKGQTLAALFLATFICPLATHADDNNVEGRVRIGRMIYADGRTTRCFSEGFLSLVGRHTQINISRSMQDVQLGSDEIFDHPMIIMSGEKGFELSGEEIVNLRKFLMRGGFVLASAGCSNKPWDESFRLAIQFALPEYQFRTLAMTEPIFHTLFDIDSIQSVKPASEPILGLQIDGRLAIVYSPLGLNDSRSLGGKCCCCGANELRNARFINANAVVYALTH